MGEIAMNWNDWLQPPLLTSLIIGGYGAILATATFIQNTRKNRRGWKIMTGTAYAVEPDSRSFVMMTFVNQGYRPITIDQMTLELPGGNWLANFDSRMPNGQIPTTLSDSQSISVYFGHDDIRSALRRTGATATQVTPIAKDASGRIYRGKMIDVPVAI